MKNHYAIWLLAAGLLSVGSAPAADPPRDLTAALEATRPSPALGDHAHVLSRVVGTWDVEYTDFAQDGTATHRTGEFIVGWVMAVPSQESRYLRSAK